MKLTHTNRIGLVILLFIMPVWANTLREKTPWQVTLFIYAVFFVSYVMFQWDSEKEK